MPHPLRTLPPSVQHVRHIVPPYLLATLLGNVDDAALSSTLQNTLAGGVEKYRLREPVLSPNDPDVADQPGPRRTVSTAANTTTLPGTTVRVEGAPESGDAAVDEAYTGLGATWDLFDTAFGRDSIDGKGMPLLATVHYDSNYDNAFFDGTQMVFGDGDGQYFGRFTKPLDVVGHELTHGVTAATANLTYQDQSGALNESISDCFGSMVKQKSLGQSAEQADWIIGAGLFTAAVNGVGLRSMKAPGTAYDDPALGKDPQPATMEDYVSTTDDNGGVHLNSGIPNHAFYLAAVAVGGNAWEGAGRVWYAALTGGQLVASADFATFAGVTVRAAGTLFGADSSQQSAISSAWTSVGVTPAPAL